MEDKMGTVYAEITIKNAFDVCRFQDGQITEDKVRSVTLTAIVDTGATTLVINEEIFNQLGLSVKETRMINLAGGARMAGKVTDPVDIHWKNRYAATSAIVLPKGKPLLGVIPLEFMDLIVDPTRLELVGANGDEALLMAM
jgi:clan AA aspartic protease